MTQDLTGKMLFKLWLSNRRQICLTDPVLRLESAHRRKLSMEGGEDGGRKKKDSLSEGPWPLLGLRGPACGAQRKSYHYQKIS